MSEKGVAERDILVPAWGRPEPYFEFDKVQKEQIAGLKDNPWRVVPDDKSKSCHKQASTCESLLNIYPKAIEVGSAAGSGEMFVLGVFGAFIGLAGMILGGFLFKIFGLVSLVSILPFIMMILGFMFFMLFLRVAFFTPSDYPLIFNRATRQVSFIPMVPVPFWKFWKKVGLAKVQTVPWDATKVRSYKIMEAPGGRVFREVYLLRLLWEDSARPRKLKIWMNIGYKGWWEDERLFRLWEHIRRYMEEDGPAIQPGETLRTSGHGKLPKFPADIIDAAGGPALSSEEVAALSGEV